MTKDVRETNERMWWLPASFLLGEEGSQGVWGWVAFRIWGLSAGRRVEATGRDGGGDLGQADHFPAFISPSPGQSILILL